MCWKIRSKGMKVIEVWENFYGDLYFTVEILPDGTRFGYVRFFDTPEFAEWGEFNIDDIKESIGQNMIWKVTRENWSNINSYEPGLLVECQ